MRNRVYNFRQLRKVNGFGTQKLRKSHVSALWGRSLVFGKTHGAEFVIRSDSSSVNFVLQTVDFDVVPQSVNHVYPRLLLQQSRLAA
jgi:hypothetical protein